MLKNSANYDGIKMKDSHAPYELEIYEMDPIWGCLESKPDNFAGATCLVCLGEIDKNTVLGP